MGIDKQRNPKDDETSEIRSLGSNYQRCSQSRKMSIGVAAASYANVSNFAGSKYNSQGKKGSPWISPKPLTKSRNRSESFTTVTKVDNIPHVNVVNSNLGGVNEPTATILQSSNGKQKKAYTVFSGKGSMKSMATARGMGLLLEAVGEISVPDERMKQDKPIKEDKPMENRSKEALKLKLWEALGTVPSINKEMNDAKSVEVDNIMVQKDGPKEDASFKPRVNSDTIETDSENPELAVSRPVTRSLTRKRGPVMAQPRRLRKKLFPATEDVFSFEDKCFSAQHAANGRQLRSKARSNGNNDIKIRTTKTSVPLQERSNIKQASSGSKRSLNTEEISLRSGMGIAHVYLGQERRNEAVRSEKSHSSPEAKDSGQLSEGDDPMSPENDGKKDQLHCESAPKKADWTNHLFSPANKMKTTAQVPQPCAQANEIENQNYTEMLAKRILSVRDSFRFKSGLTAKQINQGSNIRTELSDGPVESDDTVQSVREKHDAELSAAGRLEFDKTEEELFNSNSSGEDLDATPERIKYSELSPALSSPNVSGEDKETTPESAHVEKKQMPFQSNQVNIHPENNYGDPCPAFSSPNGCGEDMDTVPEVGHFEKQKLHPRGHQTHEGVDYNALSPALSSPLATRFTEASPEYQEDGLERDIALLGRALENFKNKLLCSTKKRSSNILESAAEEIHSRFQSAKSQIEKDVTKLISTSRSKRKILEKSFEEQQEQLRLIHEKFRDEIHRHLQEFTRTVESLEAHETELKGVIERRKASYHKLVLQVEAAAENHLSDTQKRLMSIRNMGTSKMQRLKNAVAECLEGGIFT